MEIALYLLILIFLQSDGNIRYYKPMVYSTKAECEYKKMSITDLLTPDSVIGSVAVCVKMSVREEQTTHIVLDKAES